MAKKKKKQKNLGKKTGDYSPLNNIPDPLFLPPGNPIDKKKAKVTNRVNIL